MINSEDMKRLLNSPFRLLAPVEKFLIGDYQIKNAERDKAHLHPSEICKRDWCPRSSYYKISGLPTPPERLSLQRMNIFEEGHSIHRKWQKWFKDAGILVQDEVPVLDEMHRIIGHADAIIEDKHGKAVVEIKSVGVGTIRMEDYGLFAPYAKKEITIDELWNRVKFPFDSHVRQVQLYMSCLKIEDALILYEWKPTQDVKEFVVKFQPDIVDSILASCHSVVRALEEQVPPNRPVWLSQEHRICKACPFKTECWNESSTKSSDGSGDDKFQAEVRPTITTTDGDSNDPRPSRRIVRQQIDGAL
jgi:CRISPR/Cas system-associated exonuclease Cas4 (RecB family)